MMEVPLVIVSPFKLESMAENWHSPVEFNQGTDTASGFVATVL